ncbi:MAG: gamma-glutamyl-gamma-aminobutyrate hydrolase family protein [Burkholderiales bacterium]
MNRATNPASPEPINAKPGRPVVLVPADNRMLGEHPFHVAGKKYVDAVRLAGCLPLVVPCARADEVDELLPLADGVLLTGSPSNVNPRLFGQEVHDPSLPLDPVRDEWTLPLTRRALELGVPLFAICRGFQETNVALGGTLFQAIHELPDKDSHRAAPTGASAEAQYALAHEVRIVPGGLLEGIVGAGSVRVNSVHDQGADRLAPGARAEALAPDGLVEAFSIPAASGFNLCLQWHPEWQAADNPVSMKLLRAFGDACRRFRDQRRVPERDPDR